MNNLSNKPCPGPNAQRMLSNFEKLPEWCYVHLPTTKEPVIVMRGEDGYRPPAYPGVCVEEINGLLGVTPEQEEAMLCGSMFGWHTPAADPDTWHKDERWQAAARASGRKPVNPFKAVNAEDK